MQAPSFQSEDEAARYYIGVLRDGTDLDKIEARAQLAAIFERRGMFDEALELYERNARAGVRTPELFKHLSEVYRRVGDADSAEAALAEAERVEAEHRYEAERERDAERLHAGQPPTQASQPETSENGRVVPLPTILPSDAAVPDEAFSDQPDQVVPPYPADTGHRTGFLGILGIVVFLIFLPVAVLALLVVNPVSLYLEGKAAGPRIDARDSSPARVKVAPGWAAAWYVRDGRSVTGLWSTSGLDLVLDPDASGANRRFTVTPATAQPWGETITVVERRGEGRSSQETTIPASFTVPADLTASDGVVRGRIVGQVTAPRLTEGGQFATSADAIDRPIELTVVLPPELLLDRFVNSVSMYFEEDRWLLVTIGALLCWCVLAGATAVIVRLAG